MTDTTKYCPCCGRHCDLSAPHCGRGEEYARTGVIPEGHGHEHHSDIPRERQERVGSKFEQEGRGKYEHPHRSGKSILASEHYKALPTEDKLMALLRELGGIGRHGFDGKGSQSRILSMLKKDGTITQRQLTEQLGIQPGSASEVLGKLESAGLILRMPSEADRRTTTVSLTEAGEAKAVELQQNPWFSCLTTEEMEQLLPPLEKLHAAWSQQRKKGGHHGRDHREHDHPPKGHR